MPGIYDEPELYEAACAYRDVPREADALLRWSGKYRIAAAGPLRSVLELAAGPAEHARELAGRGLEATALDLSAAMCARASRADNAAATPVSVSDSGALKPCSPPKRWRAHSRCLSV